MPFTRTWMRCLRSSVSLAVCSGFCTREGGKWVRRAEPMIFSFKISNEMMLISLNNCKNLPEMSLFWNFGRDLRVDKSNLTVMKCQINPPNVCGQNQSSISSVNRKVLARFECPPERCERTQSPFQRWCTGQA